MGTQIEIEFWVEDDYTGAPDPDEEPVSFSTVWQTVPRIGEIVAVPDHEGQPHEDVIPRRVLDVSWGCFWTGSHPIQTISGKGSCCVKLSKDNAFSKEEK